MFVVTVIFSLKPGNRAAFLPRMTENARLSVEREAGCRQFDVCTDGGDEVFLYEVYDSKDAFDAHLQSAHFKDFDAAVSDMIADKAIRTYAEMLS